MAKARQIHKENSAMTSLIDKHGMDVKQFNSGDLVEGIIVSITHDAIMLDIGAKSEAVIPAEEYSSGGLYEKNLKVGDTISAVVVQSESDQGYALLSIKRAEKELRWSDIEEAFKNESVLEITILEYNKGGLLVDCMGLRGFVPLSHLDRVHFADNAGKFAGGSEQELKDSLKILAGTQIKAKVIEFDKEKNRLVLSEKDATNKYSDEAREKRLEEVSEGDISEGIVTGIMPFGVFVDLDGIEGLVHISEIAWEKVSHPSKYFAVGSPIRVKVLGVDDRTKKLALSVKRLTENPWENAEEKYPVGAVIEGEVSKIVPFGAFINLEKGLDGLIHVSETEGPLEMGQKVKAIVTNVDSQNQKLALSVRQLEEKE